MQRRASGTNERKVYGDAFTLCILFRHKPHRRHSHRRHLGRTFAVPGPQPPRGIPGIGVQSFSSLDYNQLRDLHPEIFERRWFGTDERVVHMGHHTCFVRLMHSKTSLQFATFETHVCSVSIPARNSVKSRLACRLSLHVVSRSIHRVLVLSEVEQTFHKKSLLYFIHFDTQSRNQDIWLPSKRFVITSVVYPRVFEILTTLTFGALRKNHIVSPAFDTIKKKRRDTEASLSTCDHQCIMKFQAQNRSKKGSLREKRSRSDVHDGSTRKRRYL